MSRMAPMATRHRLLETVPLRRLDLWPRLALAVDALSDVHDADCANALAQIALRVDTWSSRRFCGRLPAPRG